MVDGTLGNPTTELLAAPKSVVVSNPVVETAVIAPDEAPAPSITDVPYPTVPSLSPPSTPNPASVVVVVSAPKAAPVEKAAPAPAPSITEVPYPTVPSFSPPSTPNPPSATFVVPKSTVPKLVVPKSTV